MSTKKINNLKLIKNNSDKGVKSTVDSGKLFEEIVGLVLKKMYPKYNFHHTEYRHDGGKDFYATYGTRKIWAEAKCHERHLELSRIAGTFIMADICRINCIIIFSKKRLTNGALSNLAKYCERHGKTLLVHNESDLQELIPTYGEYELSEIISDMLSFNVLSAQEIRSLVENLNYRGKPEDEIYKDLMEILQLDSSHVKNYDEFLYKLLAYAAFNNKISHKQIKKPDRGVKVVESDYFMQVNCGTQVHLTRELKAFDVFSNEIVLHNEDLYEAKQIHIKFDNPTTQYKSISNISFNVKLLPGQCASKVFYFKALNDALNIVLPTAEIQVDCEAVKFKPTNRTLKAVPCQIVGETPYIGHDNEKLSKCCIKLDGCSERRFQPILVYGNSGVGKSRFLYELHSARLKCGNRGYLIQGDNAFGSLNEFLRSIMCAYYDINFDALGDAKIDNLQIKGIKKQLNLLNAFAVSVFTEDQKTNFVDAEKWLVSFLKNNAVSLFIDNCQNLNAEILGLLNSVINDLQNCSCRSEIVLCFNLELFLNDSIAGTFFQYLKNYIQDENFKIQIAGFNRSDATKYLMLSLDPDNRRGDLVDLCEKIVGKAFNNEDKEIEVKPLLLKQIVLYLFQKKVIGFRNNTVCILNFDALEKAAEYLPADLHSVLQQRFSLLLAECSEQKEQLLDLMWAVLIFDELPELFVNKIDGIESGTLKRCIELGFLKYTVNNAIIFEHQLIGKSVLLALENSAYKDLPVITSICLRKSTADNFLSSPLPNKYFTELFILKERYREITSEDFNKSLNSISLKNLTELLIPYTVDLVERYIGKFNETLSPIIKINALQQLIDACQDRLGLSRTQHYFEGIIDFQIKNYNYNRNCAKQFIELLKTYQYQLPNGMKETHLSLSLKIAESFFCGEDYKDELSDYRIWNCWASGKHYLNVYNYEKAKEIILGGIELSKQNGNNHRIAELSILLGDMYACLDDKNNTLISWEDVIKNFNTEGFYDIILGKIYEGNVALINKNYETAKQVYEFLRDKYDHKECFTFLKCAIYDYISNYLILKFVNEKAYSETAAEDIKSILNKFRSLSAIYQKKTYLHVAHKTLTFYKYLIENFSDVIEEYKLQAYASHIEIICNELLTNCAQDNFQFAYFYPVFKEIAEIAGFNEETFGYLINSVPGKYREMFTALSKKRTPIVKPKLLRGVFSDKNNMLTLFHYSYYWQ